MKYIVQTIYDTKSILYNPKRSKERNYKEMNQDHKHQKGKVWMLDDQPPEKRPNHGSSV